MESSNDSEKWEQLTRVQRLGELLVRLNALKLSQLSDLIEEQMKNPELRLGELAVQKGLITRENLVKYLEIQISEGKVVDESLKELGKLDDSEKWEKLSRHERLGEILIRKNVLKLSQLSDVMEQQSNSKKPLGELLIEKGLITESDLTEILEMQKKIKGTLAAIKKEVE